MLRSPQTRSVCWCPATQSRCTCTTLPVGSARPKGKTRNTKKNWESRSSQSCVWMKNGRPSSGKIKHLRLANGRSSKTRAKKKLWIAKAAKYRLKPFTPSVSRSTFPAQTATATGRAYIWRTSHGQNPSRASQQLERPARCRPRPGGSDAACGGRLLSGGSNELYGLYAVGGRPCVLDGGQHIDPRQRRP